VIGDRSSSCLGSAAIKQILLVARVTDPHAMLGELEYCKVTESSGDEGFRHWETVCDPSVGSSDEAINCGMMRLYKFSVNLYRP